MIEDGRSIGLEGFLLRNIPSQCRDVRQRGRFRGPLGTGMGVCWATYFRASSSDNSYGPLITRALITLKLRLTLRNQSVSCLTKAELVEKETLSAQEWYG
jgi:hypothetical protein